MIFYVLPNLITNVFVEIKLDDKSKWFIADANKEYNEWCNSLSVDYILYEGLTKGACKKFKVSPDCIMQLAFQVRHFYINL